MRKKKIFHAVISAMLTLSLAVPAVSLGAVPAAADEAAKQPIAVYDFEDGLRGFYNTDKDNFEIIKSGTVVVKKVGDEIEKDASGVVKDLTDANGFLYQGSGSSAHYALQQVSNQPLCAFDAERGTVFNLCKTYKLEALVKEKSAGTGDAATDAALDAALKEGDEVRKAATYKSAITCSNPFAKLDQAGAVLAFWGKASADVETGKTAFMEFDKDTTAVSFCFDAASNVKVGEWHYYTYVISAGKIDTYIDGKAAEGMTSIDGEAPADFTAFLKEAKIYLGASNLSTLETHEATRLDNVSFYNGAMTAEEVAALYEAETAAVSVDVTKPDNFIAMDSADSFTDVDKEAPAQVKDFNINGHTVKGVAVAENAKASTKAGIKLNENPFAGKRLTGASISFWLRSNVKAKKAAKGDMTMEDTIALSFIDQEKMVFNPKEESKSKEDITTFNFHTNMAFNFKEGVLSDVNTGNLYSGLVEDTQAADKYVADSNGWHFITLNINNNGVTPYYDGVKVEGYIRGQGSRFMDGYYVRYGTEGSTEKADISNPVKLYGMFGGDNNQRATMMMSAFAYADMDLYFGYFPSSDLLTELTSPIDVTRISCFNNELSDAQVKALYDQETAYVNAQPEYREAPQGKKGDINSDGDVNAQDALLALQIAAKMTEQTETHLTYGDLNDDGNITAADALVMLQIAAKVVPQP